MPLVLLLLASYIAMHPIILVVKKHIIFSDFMIRFGAKVVTIVKKCKKKVNFMAEIL